MGSFVCGCAARENRPGRIPRVPREAGHVDRDDDSERNTTVRRLLRRCVRRAKRRVGTKNASRKVLLLLQRRFRRRHLAPIHPSTGTGPEVVRHRVAEQGVVRLLRRRGVCQRGRTPPRRGRQTVSGASGGWSENPRGAGPEQRAGVQHPQQRGRGGFLGNEQGERQGGARRRRVRAAVRWGRDARGGGHLRGLRPGRREEWFFSQPATGAGTTGGVADEFERRGADGRGDVGAAAELGGDNARGEYTAVRGTGRDQEPAARAGDVGQRRRGLPETVKRFD
mmetsp:Transcript_12087/g.50870  ORF Transcript_12087/g.50870 Transcript_12087/m.50870 type:complete len:281 (-) Transcript_12087:10-852(-)